VREKQKHKIYATFVVVCAYFAVAFLNSANTILWWIKIIICRHGGAKPSLVVCKAASEILVPNFRQRTDLSQNALW